MSASATEHVKRKKTMYVIQLNPGDVGQISNGKRKKFTNLISERLSNTTEAQRHENDLSFRDGFTSFPRKKPIP